MNQEGTKRQPQATIDTAFARIGQLVEAFDEHRAAYFHPTYSEARIRQDFIDKMLTAFGWDVGHEYQRNPFEQEVRVEKNVEIPHAQKRADYAFFVAPNFKDVRFFLEAKRPSAALATSDHYFQTIRYGWNSGTPLAFLSDFVEVHVLDCRNRPNIDTALQCRVESFHYTEYRSRERFERLYYLLSREAVAAGGLEKIAAGLPSRRGPAVQRGLFRGGYQGIDASFLADLEEYRAVLAKSLKNRNPDLDGESLTELTQRILDRLVFLRFLEDKLIETDEQVGKFGDSGSAWHDFRVASRRLDTKYNGIVYKVHPLLDSNALRVDDDVFGDICERFADVNSPYNFDLIPIHILGNIYERFLGRVIVTTDKRARVEEKPEVRKAGGVYYTPEYVVRYIVAQTVGRLIEGKSPAQIAAMRFADISCGSGSFLLAVFDTLLRYHREWYNANPSKAKRTDCWRDDDGRLRLTLQKRREVLLNNVFGVDIDPQAVEVAQLSLYLKLLEEETTASAWGFQHEMHAALLPALSKNILCGNSLVEPGPDTGDLFGTVKLRTINPMSFAREFPQIMSAGGFDAIVGNPPYVRPHRLEAEFKEYLWEHYKTFIAKSDLYSCFMERAVDLVRPGGVVGFIVPHTWTSLESFQGIRQKLFLETNIRELVQLPKKVFRDATVETCIFVVEKSSSGKASRTGSILVTNLDERGHHDKVREFPQSDIAKAHLNNFQLYADSETGSLLEHCKALSVPLGSLVQFVYGFKTADDSRFIAEVAVHEESKPFVRSASIFRYYVGPATEYVWYVPAKMIANRSTARPGDKARFESEKIVVSRMGKMLVCAYDPGGLYVKDAMLLLPGATGGVSLKYILAILNSSLLGYLYRRYFITVDVLKNAILGLPIRRIDLRDSSQKALHDELVLLVDQIADARKQFERASKERDREYFARMSEELSARIDERVYQLYDLSTANIRTVTAT